MTTKEVLIEARAQVAQGWTQKNYCDADGNVCASAAFREFINSDTDAWFDARKLFKHVIGAKSIPEWNDAPGRTQADVLAAFDKAIEAAS